MQVAKLASPWREGEEFSLDILSHRMSDIAITPTVVLRYSQPFRFH